MFRSQLQRLLIRSVSGPLLCTPMRHHLGAITTTTKISTPAFPRFNSSSTTITTDGVVIPKSVLELSVADYHQYADDTLEGMIEDLEELMDSKDCGDLDSELSNGILTLSLPQNGDYVINKQPPNKQIWFSSPISGPNRFDYIDGQWISLRDHANLLQVLEKEIGESLGLEFKFTKEE